MNAGGYKFSIVSRVSRSKCRTYHWRIHANNGMMIAKSGNFSTKRAALSNAWSVRRALNEIDIEYPTPMVLTMEKRA